MSVQPASSGNALLWRIVGAILAISAIAVSFLYWELIWELLSEGVILALEAGEEALDTVYEAIGLNPALSQIATAYTGFVLGLVLVYFIVRKTVQLAKILQKKIALYRDAYGTVYKQWQHNKQERILAWWESLDWMQKTAAISALLLIGIPLAMLASFLLGELVTMFIA
ncbi:hypothetical protein F6R98_18690 [Candidatus Methylospira mobilis]|uniref:Uncharacterized protein n=1 Tax=Candidatus Methylospira mobilis TaxID=1808979 RepID=A0A5Q0BLD2_9GAMM|nr:hypothetical protein [Candidatus Methylospira mobilis]QFY44409.1 hypothetical protein F6R98_18690 [Candidatus Methylospira mobilis]WNV06154.1 hypothetical protein RP726_07005 [Candidatus Methylospira mobilis]